MRVREITILVLGDVSRSVREVFCKKKPRPDLYFIDVGAEEADALVSSLALVIARRT